MYVSCFLEISGKANHKHAVKKTSYSVKSSSSRHWNIGRLTW